MSATFDSTDFLRFAPIARKLATKKGSLKEVKIGIESPKPFHYFLFGNILYSFEHENDPNSVNNIYFLEGSTCKVTSNLDQFVLAITLVGGKKLSLTSNSEATNSHAVKEELNEWMEAIESNKFVQITRKLDDFESNLLQLQHKTEQNELVYLEYEKTINELQKQIKDLTNQNQSQENTIQQLTQDKNNLSKRLKDVENERLLLLKSRGITPKSTPIWALSDITNRKGILNEPISKCKLWVGSWNLSGKEPFMNIPSQKATTLLVPFVPSGYDLYVFNVQESPSESIFDCFDSLLNPEGCQRLKLDYNHVVLQNIRQDDEHGGNGSSSDPTKLYSKDGKFNGIVIYVRQNLLSDVKLLAMAAYNCASSSSSTSSSSSSSRIQGGIAVALSVLGRNLVFINSQLNHKSNDVRREQYQQLMIHLGSSLAELGYHLNEQFHHVIWSGDLCFKLVDVSGNEMPLDTVSNMLEDPRLVRTLFETHDQLNQEKKLHNIFYGYREPVPFPNFYPTYKKIENHPPVNYSRPDWVKNTYRFYMKDSFFKGGKTKEFTPQFSDRILFYSMNDLVEDLLPESLPSEMYIIRGSEDKEIPSSPFANNNGKVSALTSSLANTGILDSTAQLSVQVDNYRSINEGEALIASDHSPVCCTFLLRVKHDHSHLIEAKAKLNAVNGDINDVLSVLAIDNPNIKAELSKSPSKKSYLLKEKEKEDPYLTPNRNKSSERQPSNEGENGLLSTPITPFNAFSLLPHGIYHVKITDMKLIWGINEEYPLNVQVLFPAPFEAVAGERFTDFRQDDSFTPAKGIRPASTKTPVSNSKNQPALPSDLNSWKRLGSSKSGTCLRLGVDRTADGASDPIPPLIITWKGDEPLDRLHLCLKASMLSKSIVGNSSSKSSSRNSGKMDMSSLYSIDNDDRIVGHCSISLEQLCKVALANAASSSATVAAPRIMVHRGRPMHNLDGKTLQREIVTFYCKLELLL